ncbi:DNA cytosine methyltransferase [Pseudomonas aeruginosa]|uniref:DNA (cytosine-5-)-methyltransferase n=2 Tax=root TaxID=1 RepID=A0A6G9LJF0_9CAUD|nr:DNA cytosine methyltransferase [Pseudomonas aeruginosa]YP_010765964.1 C-5 cytosine-specific DNA methylase [Pseudomonas phage Epa33]QIQ65755.1 C-5 cytosine-specific DNA methylase [Pseudomonas phage Epa33]QMX84140.1 DNA cytosine methyltransferase [Pseudomonas aeruginosa]RPP76679.1 DNA cytosine methyltransferase [Pseudomonas aeruginosa]UEG09967.1 DNA cytosine methyltransferase [Pseudomonas aeruginosa]HBP0062085.1 DNA cytosine methyltransferase [Pseudomonas aeruginosa]
MTSLKKPSPLDFKTQYGLALDDTDDAIIVDLFAGGGGASTGLEMGLGRKVDLAINHNPAAISMHEANHPHAEHLPTDVWGIDPIASTKGATVGWLHASPDCRHHSQAAGGQPRKKEIRDLSWVVVKWAGKLQKLGRGPWVISLENVKQILQWGPLIAKRDKSTGRVVRLDGTVAEPGERVPRHEQFLVPDPKRKGRTWRQFLRALEGFGYHVDYWVERNCDYGDPTTRQRLYLVATDGGFEPVAAEKTHAAKPGKGLKPYRTAAECIDWSDLGQSIRNRKRPLAEATMRRIAKGIEKEVLQRAQPFIVPIANWSREAVHPVDQPLNTVTAWPKGGAFSVATPTLIQVGYGERDGQAPRVLELDEPLGTVVAGGIKHAVAAAHLVKFRFDATGAPVDQPMPTITSGGECKRPAGAAHALGLASAVLVGAGGPSYSGKPASVDQPLGTVVTENHRAIATAFLAQMNGGYNTTFSRPADAPMSTVTNSGSQQQLVTAHLLHLRGNCDARAADEPLHTVSAGGQHHGLVSALLVTNTTGHSSTPADQPAPTVATGGHHMLVTPEMIAGSLTPEQLDGAVWVAAFLMKYHGMGENIRPLDEPVSTVTTKDRLALVTVWISGSPYVIVDIRLRMLKPRELYRAQGFPDSYIIERGHNGQRFTLSQQVHMCGNSVSPNTMAAYARANDPWKRRLRPSPQQVAA